MPEQVALSKRLRSADPRAVAVCVSIIFSWLVTSSQVVLNDDAYSYLKAAETFSDQGLKSTLGLYGWYGYSVVIALADSILPTTLINSAHLFNALCFALLTWFFITLVNEFSRTKEAAIFAAIVILCYPTINEMRFALVRDFGYWASCLAGLIQLIRYSRHGKIENAVGWVISMGIAVFFRLEGLLLVMITPFALFVVGHDRAVSIGRFFKLVSLLIGAAILLLAIFIFSGIDLVDIFRFAYRWYLPLLADYPGTITGAAENTSLSFHMSEQIRPFTGKGVIILFLGYFYTVVLNIIMAIGPAFSLFILYGLLTSWRTCDTVLKSALGFYLASSVVALIIFVSIMQFLTTRYAVMTSLFLLVLMPLILEVLYASAMKSGNQKRFHGIFAVLIMYFFVDSLFSFGYSKHYLDEAISWARDIPAANEQILTNNSAIAYHSGRVANYDEVETDIGTILAATPSYEYLVVEVAHDDEAARSLLNASSRIEESLRFSNSRNDAVIVYRILQ